MNNPIRYNLNTVVGIVDEDGMWVQWQDYSRLKAEVDELKRMLEASTFGIEFAKEDIKKLEAEVERLRLQVGTDAIDREHGMCCDSSAENARLKAEVERLRKAGDTMACHLVCSDLPNDVCGDLMKDWNAAKEGKQSV